MSRTTKSSKTRPASKGSSGDLYQGMPIAQALHNYPDAREELEGIFSNLLGATALTISAFQQTLGESYTGGRSTPVYEVQLSDDETGKEHFLVIKLVVQEFDGDVNDTTSKQVMDYAARVRSYQVESGFYGHANPRTTCPARACARVGLHIPTLLSVEQGGAHRHETNDKRTASILFVMNDLRRTHPSHPPVLSISQAKVALAWLAKFHSRFWEAPKLLEEWSDDLVWEEGSFWALQYKMQQLLKIPDPDLDAIWTKTLRWLQRKAPSTGDSSSIKLMGQRLNSCRPAVYNVLHDDGAPTMPNLSPVIYSKIKQTRRSFRPPRRHVTMVHGDYKAANMFFVDETSCDDSCDNQCAVCDFQFAGPGLGASDLAYLLFPDPRVHYLDDESSLLDWYYQRLCMEMDKLGKDVEGYTRMTLNFHYGLAQIEILTHLLSKGWVASSPNDVRLLEVIDDTLKKLDGGIVLKPEDYRASIDQILSKSE